MINMNSVVAIFDSHQDAEAALNTLQQAGIDVTKLSIVGRDYQSEEHVTGYYNTGDRVKYWGKLGAFWGGLWGLLVGAAVFVMPGIGPVVVAGPFAASVLGGLEGALTVGGMSALGAGLFSIGIPKNSVLQYETAINADRFLLIVHGGADEVAKVEDLLQTTSAASVEAHSGAPEANTGDDTAVDATAITPVTV